jgi:P-type Cu2+ transporter
MTILDVGGMLSKLDYRGVEKQVGKMPGVRHATVNIASGTATVEYDGTVTSVARLRDKINECGFHCTGQIMPKHLWEGHPGHMDEHGVPVDHAAQTTRAEAYGAATLPMAISHDMAPDMGHGTGVDMRDMVRDMRNRFWFSLVFTVLIFIYSPMSNMFTPPAPPFGLRLDLWLFFLASAAILNPAWPFVTDAIRALRNGNLSNWLSASRVPTSTTGPAAQPTTCVWPRPADGLASPRR